MSFDYDLFVIGAGSGGLAASKRAASYGAKVAIAERDLVGGTCVIRGCVPKKLMVYASKFSHFYEEALGYGWSEVASQFNWSQLIDALQNEVHRLSKLHISFLEKAGVDLIQGQASLIDAHTIAVDDRKITADKILIAVGGHAIKPDLPGMEHTITSREMFLLPEQPKRLVIVGAGYISVEFAGIMQGLGTQVTQLIRRDKPLRGFDEDIRTDVVAGMAQHGIEILANTAVQEVEKVDEGVKIVFTEKDKLEKGSTDEDKTEPDREDATTSMVADQVLMAIGRASNLEGLGLDKAGVAIENGAIAVDENSRTSQENIFAVGDCTDRINLTPVAIAEGRAFADTEFGNNPRVMSHECVPSAVFSQPEAATVGLTEAEAREQLGDAVKCYRARFRPLFHALTGAAEKTTVKLVIDSNTDRVLGSHMVGDGAAEIIQGVAIALKMGATKQDFDNTVGIHPSTAEEFVTLR